MAPDLALDVVADDRHAGGGELLRPLRVTGDEHGDGVHERHARVEGGLGVVLLRHLGPDGQVGDEHIGPRRAQDRHHVDRLGGGFLDGLAVVLPQPVEGRAPLDHHADVAHRGETDGVVLPREDGLAQVEADLGGVDIEGGHELDVTDVVAAQADVHQAGNALRRVGGGSTRRPAGANWRSCRRRRWRPGSCYSWNVASA